MSDEKSYDSQFRRVLKRLSPVLKKHAEILASCEAKKTHDVWHIVGSNGKVCTVYNFANQNTKRR